MNRQQLIDDLDRLAGQLSTLAREVNTIKVRLELDPEGAPAPKARGGHSAARWTREEAADARRRAIDLKQSPEEIGAALDRTPAAVMTRLRKDLDAKVYNAWLKGCRR